MSDNEGVQVLLALLGMDVVPTREPRYIIAPTQSLDVVQQQAEELALVPMHWGVRLTLPVKSGKLVTRHIQNARSDNVFASPRWKGLIARQRVLVPVNGFYEWRRKNRRLEAAFSITPAGKPAMFFAGIYRAPKDDTARADVSILTTDANQAMNQVHDRMPVVLGSQNAAMAWLIEDDRTSLEALMQPAANNALKFTEVSQTVNDSRHEGPDCIAPLAA